MPIIIIPAASSVQKEHNTSSQADEIKHDNGLKDRILLTSQTALKPSRHLRKQLNPHRAIKPEPQPIPPISCLPIHATQPLSSCKNIPMEDMEDREIELNATLSSSKTLEQEFYPLRSIRKKKRRHRSKILPPNWTKAEKDRLLQIVKDLQSSQSTNTLSPTQFWKRAAELLGSSRSDRACQSLYLHEKKQNKESFSHTS